MLVTLTPAACALAAQKSATFSCTRLDTTPPTFASPAPLEPTTLF